MVSAPLLLAHANAMSCRYAPPLGQSFQPRFKPSAEAVQAIRVRRAAVSRVFFIVASWTNDPELPPPWGDARRLVDADADMVPHSHRSASKNPRPRGHAVPQIGIGWTTSVVSSARSPAIMSGKKAEAAARGATASCLSKAN